MAVKRVNEIPISESNPLGGGSGVVEVIERVIVDEETKNLVQELKAIIETQATTITNQAIAINKQNELIKTVDSDLNGLVGDVSE